jgi:hypothetical protein
VSGKNSSGSTLAQAAELAGPERLAAAALAGPVVAFHLGGQPLGIGGAAGDGGLLVAAGGEVRLQPGELLGGGAAVADGLAEDLHALRALVLGAQPGQPLAGDRGGRGQLGRQLGRVKPPATCQLPAQVGVGDPIPHQPRPQLGKASVTLAVGAQHPHQIIRKAGCHADLAGEGGRVNPLA